MKLVKRRKEYEKKMVGRGWRKVEILDVDGYVIEGFSPKVDIRRYFDASKSNVKLRICKYNEEEIKIKEDKIHTIRLI